MKNTLIDGQAVADLILLDVKKRVLRLKRRGLVPKLGVVLVGDNPASKIYVRHKQKAAEQAGITFILHHLPSAISEAQLISTLKKIQSDKKLHGLIVQLPLPEKLFTRRVLNTIRPNLDIDFLNDASLGSLISRSNRLEPPTASAMLALLRSVTKNISGAHVVVVGAGALVGRPLTFLLLNANATVTVCHIKTKNLGAITRLADIIMTCVGKKNLIRGAMVKPGSVVIDAGFALERGRAVGDVNVAEVCKVARAVTPTPGGVGPVTIAKLLLNTVLSAENKI